MSALLTSMPPLDRYASRIGSSPRTSGGPADQPTALAAADERLATRSEIDLLRATRVPPRSVTPRSVTLPATSLPSV